MRITRWGEYGILCCLYLAQRGSEQPVGAAEIAKTQSIPIKYAQQILHRLRKGGVIKSVRGPHGGFLLSKQAAQISLKDILYAAEGNTFQVICDEDPLSHHLCQSKENCGLHDVWCHLKESIDEVLSQRSLASLMNGCSPTTQDKLSHAPDFASHRN